MYLPAPPLLATCSKPLFCALSAAYISLPSTNKPVKVGVKFRRFTIGIWRRTTMKPGLALPEAPRDETSC